MLRIALTAAALLFGTAAEAKPYKITMTVDYNSAYMPGTPTSGTMSFQAVLNDPLVVTTTSPGQGGLDIVTSTTRIATIFYTAVDGVTAAKSFLDLSLDWATLPSDDQGYLSIEKIIRISYNSLSIPAMVQIAKPAVEDLCKTAYKPYGDCTLGPITSTMIVDQSPAAGLDTFGPLRSNQKNILDFTLGKDANEFGYTYAEIGIHATPPAGYPGDNAWPGGKGVIEFGLTSFTISPVPEPASWAILITGFGMVGATMRRRTRVLAHA